jgi:catechol 2,3-dioxygenase-like lactoylglutathione lyase family enzyme
MLRGFATINYWTDDMEAATRWYAELLGVEPYFDPALVGQRLVHRGQVGAGGVGEVVEADDRHCRGNRQVPLVRRLDCALGE